MVAANILNSTVSNSISVSSGTTASRSSDVTRHERLQHEHLPQRDRDRDRQRRRGDRGAARLAAGNATINLVNVIAYSGPGALSLKARTDNSGAQAAITATHYRLPVLRYGRHHSPHSSDGGGNQCECRPSSTLPRATTARRPARPRSTPAFDPLNGAFDVDGDPRTIGTTDIGADEFVAAPTATTASAVTDPAAAPTTQAPSPTPPTRACAGVRLVSSRLAFARGRITVTLRCPAGTVGRCTGRTKLAARNRRPRSSAASTVILGRAPFSIAPGQRVKVKVRVSRAGRRLLGGAHPLRANDTNAARNGAGQSKTRVTAVTIRRRHR